jgi:hypothetical protein
MKKKPASYRYVIKTVGECTEDDRISVDPKYTVGELAGMIAAHNAGAMNLEDQVWFGTRDSYSYAPKAAPALVALPV